MRVLAVDADAIVFVSGFWQTTCTALRAGDEGFLIDSPVLPHELEALPQVLEQSGFPVSGLLVTHGDWDHLLGRHAFPERFGRRRREHRRAARRPIHRRRSGSCRRSTRSTTSPDGRRSRSTSFRACRSPVDLTSGATGSELELHPTPGHTADGTAYLAPWLGVLVCGDYLSPVEIPWISESGSAVTYLETLERLRGLVQRVQTVVPGHGGPIPAARRMTLLDEDTAYLRALLDVGAEAPLPSGRQTGAQQKIHAENVQRVAVP